MLCEDFDFSFEKDSQRVQMLSKKLYNLHIYIDADYKMMTFYAFACIVHVQVLICYVNTRLQRIFIKFC